MKNKILLITLLFLLGCTEQGKCLKAGESYTMSPSREITSGTKCGDGCNEILTYGDASTGYTTYTCYSKTCVAESNTKSAGEVCCDDLVYKNNICIKTTDCEFDGTTGVIIGSENLKECIKQEDCIDSGTADYSRCQRCCVGSKKLVSQMTGNYQFDYCILPGEEVPEKYEARFAHSEPITVTEEDEKEWEENCLP